MCVRFGPAHACVRANVRSCDRARASSASDMVCTHTRAGSWTDRSWTWRCTCCRMGEDNGSDANAAPAGEEEEEDAWSVFDPHDSSSHVGQPVKKGRRRTRPLRRRDSRECFDGLVVFSQTVKTTKFAS